MIFFKKKNFKLGDGIYSLDNIEYDLIFKIDSVMIHFGIVCAAVSCPKLIKQHYNSDNINFLLEKNASEFLADASKNRIDHKNKIIYLSQIFRWFKSQFEKANGSLIGFIELYSPDEWKSGKELSSYEIKFLEYNWSLNVQ